MIYTIHMKPEDQAARQSMTDDDTRFDNVLAVPETLAKWALIFPPFWLAWHRLWFALVVYCLTIIFMLGLVSTQYAIVPLLLGGLPGLYLFLEGYELVRSGLSRRGYNMIGVADAAEPTMAIEKFLAEWKEPNRGVVVSDNVERQSVFAKPTTQYKTGQHTPSFGMFGGWEA